MSTPGNLSAEILARLEPAGAAGLRKAPLLGRGKKDQPEKLAELAALVARREVVQLGTERSPVFVLARFYNPLEEARAAIEKKGSADGAAKLYTDRELGAGLAKHVKEKVAEAVRLLAGEKKLIAVRRARSVYYLHTAAILPLAGIAPAEPSPGPVTAVAPPREEISWEEVRRAYETVVREGGFSDVLIADLQRVLAIPLERLKPFLLAQSRAGRLAPSRGDWSLADAAARAAALDVQGDPYLRVRLL